ncbi:MAG: hypothetical protein O7C75_16975, partial [Verrucomicrobia bacterium]|nr:hypothetical protein [Verrucomicrobiota bacterium]
MVKELLQAVFLIALSITTSNDVLSNNASDVPTKIAIIKADDLVKPTAKWDRFIELSSKLQVNVSIGIICDSLQEDEAGYFEWLRTQQQSGSVEFWNHGWDHKRWGQEGEWIS